MEGRRNEVVVLLYSDWMDRGGVACPYVVEGSDHPWLGHPLDHVTIATAQKY